MQWFNASLFDATNAPNALSATLSRQDSVNDVAGLQGLRFPLLSKDWAKMVAGTC
jgi:hypothetical protein